MRPGKGRCLHTETFAVPTKAPRRFHCPYFTTIIKSNKKLEPQRSEAIAQGYPSELGTWGSVGEEEGGDAGSPSPARHVGT